MQMAKCMGPHLTQLIKEKKPVVILFDGNINGGKLAQLLYWCDAHHKELGKKIVENKDVQRAFFLSTKLLDAGQNHHVAHVAAGVALIEAINIMAQEMNDEYYSMLEMRDGNAPHDATPSRTLKGLYFYFDESLLEEDEDYDE